MKRLCVLVVIGYLLLMDQMIANGQKAASGDIIKAKEIPPFQIAVSFNKTSNLIFPFAIRSVDRGSAAILAQKAKGAENILQIKAGKLDFPATNLSIVTSDARFYSFLVEYAEQPSVLNLCFYKDSVSEPAMITLSDMGVNEEQLNNAANVILQSKRFLHAHVRQQKIKLSLQSIYLYNNLMWFDLKLKNKSLIDYVPDQVRFFIQDKKRAKRTAIQEREIKPLFALPYPTIDGDGNAHIVMAFSPFTIPKNQQVVVQSEEKNGGRSLFLKLRSRCVLRARIIGN
ncbi:MAG TPA: conjugative transposon protein TraN [Agriterribacter sp.]|nr:conjugative transposon protein TraN [Agriterribacter sp.]